MATSKKKKADTPTTYDAFADTLNNQVEVIEATKGKLPAVRVVLKTRKILRLDVGQAKRLRNALNAFLQEALTGQLGGRI